MMCISDYIGIPYEHAHCYELAHRIQHDLYGRQLPLFDHVNPDDMRANARLIAQERECGHWQQASDFTDGAIVLLSRANRPYHIGTYVAVDNGGIVHTSQQTGCIFTPVAMIDVGGWNVDGIYMYTSPGTELENDKSVLL